MRLVKINVIAGSSHIVGDNSDLRSRKAVQVVYRKKESYVFHIRPILQHSSVACDVVKTMIVIGGGL